MTEDLKNLLYYGDNLDILRRYVKDQSVDLVYLDPPFNSKLMRGVDGLGEAFGVGRDGGRWIP